MIAGAHAVAGLGHHRAADRDPAVGDQPLDLGPRDREVLARDEQVEALARVARRGDQGAATGRDPRPDWLPRVVFVVVVAVGDGHQIFDLTWPFDLTSTSTIARS